VSKVEEESEFMDHIRSGNELNIAALQRRCNIEPLVDFPFYGGGNAVPNCRKGNRAAVAKSGQALVSSALMGFS
jgi:hypothetical protein